MWNQDSFVSTRVRLRKGNFSFLSDFSFLWSMSISFYIETSCSFAAIRSASDFILTNLSGVCVVTSLHVLPKQTKTLQISRQLIHFIWCLLPADRQHQKQNPEKETNETYCQKTVDLKRFVCVCVQFSEQSLLAWRNVLVYVGFRDCVVSTRDIVLSPCLPLFVLGDNTEERLKA